MAAPEVAHWGERGEAGGEAAKAFLVELLEDRAVVCDLTCERTHGRRVGWCYRDGQDVAEALIRAGLAGLPAIQLEALCRPGDGCGGMPVVPVMLSAEAARPAYRSTWSPL